MIRIVVKKRRKLKSLAKPKRQTELETQVVIAGNAYGEKSFNFRPIPPHEKSCKIVRLEASGSNEGDKTMIRAFHLRKGASYRHYFVRPVPKKGELLLSTETSSPPHNKAQGLHERSRNLPIQ